MHFRIDSRLANGLGRAGTIITDHGEIKTPAFMCVGTSGAVKFVPMDDLHGINAQAMLSNGYHLRNTSLEIAQNGGLAEWSGWNGPTLTDSGGFQVMSLGSGLGKVVSMTRETPLENTNHRERLAQVTENGVEFIDPFTGAPDFIGPEESMQIQCRIGADIHMAFDELTSLADTYEYNKEALARTERWAERSLTEHYQHCDDLGYHQNLYGVLQGGHWEDLRRSTARKLAAMRVRNPSDPEHPHGFDGFGLGGAFLKEELGDILRWCNEELPEDKPRHLLGLSRPDDIFIGAEMGADTFDCVAPTREARHGRIYTRHGNINLRKYAGSEEPLDPPAKDDGEFSALGIDNSPCDCPACRAGITRGELRALWKSGDLVQKHEFYRLASLHNLRFIIRLTENIRKSIENGTFYGYKEVFLKEFGGK